MDKLKEECGIFGFYNNDNFVTSEIIFSGLYALQHRGQESAGIAVYDGERINFCKALGLVGNVFTEDLLERLEGKVGIGHVKYAQTGKTTVDNSQPIVSKFTNGSLAVAYNGSLLNADELRKKLQKQGLIFQTTTNAELISLLIAQNSVNNTNIENALTKVMKIIKGAYTITILSEDKLIALRDPFGIKPLCMGKMGKSYIIASESVAIESIGGKLVRNVLPGEIIVIDKKTMKSVQAVKENKTALCAFEFIYFARPDSTIDKVNVYNSRFKAGRLLAKQCKIEADIIIGVPDSGVPAAIGYAIESGIPYVEGFIKNRYIGRTFIQPSQFMRDKTVMLKLNPIVSNIKGKRIIMVDDSLVRGTTSKKIIAMLRKAGAKEVHFVLASPPIKYSCYYGIDSKRKHLIANKHSVKKIREIIGADSLNYITEENLIKAIENVKCNLCTACVNGKYPIKVKNKGE